MNIKTFQELKSNELVQKRLAKLMALNCFRNTYLEDLHAGISPSSKTGDCSDIKVITPYSEIPWNKLSRLNDEEMKVLMKEVVDKCYTFLYNVFCTTMIEKRMELLKNHDTMSHWDEPSFVLPPKIDFNKSYEENRKALGL